jgi:hypothetical protein
LKKEIYKIHDQMSLNGLKEWNLKDIIWYIC